MILGPVCGGDRGTFEPSRPFTKNNNFKQGQVMTTLIATFPKIHLEHFQVFVTCTSTRDVNTAVINATEAAMFLPLSLQLRRDSHVFKNFHFFILQKSLIFIVIHCIIVLHLI